MKNLFFGSILLVVTSSVFAIPNAWIDNFDHGEFHLSIRSDKNHYLAIGCYQGHDPIDSQFITVRTDKIYTLNTEGKRDDLQFLINNKKVFVPNLRNQTYSDTANWNAFLASLSTANKIEIFNNNKLLMLVTPRNPSEAESLEGCSLN